MTVSYDDRYILNDFGLEFSGVKAKEMSKRKHLHRKKNLVGK